MKPEDLRRGGARSARHEAAVEVRDAPRGSAAIPLVLDVGHLVDGAGRTGVGRLASFDTAAE